MARLGRPFRHDAADILRLQLLTGARCGEISGLCAEEIDRGQWNWTLPAARSKNKRPRVTPLVGAARQIIETRLLTVEAGPLFTAETGNALTAAHIGHYLLARRGKLPIDKFTTHDLRRTVATMLAEMGVALDLVAAVVGHEAGGKETRTLVRHYVRTDLIERKSHALRAWDERLQDIVAGREAAKRNPVRHGPVDRIIRPAMIGDQATSPRSSGQSRISSLAMLPRGRRGEAMAFNLPQFLRRTPRPSLEGVFPVSVD